MVLKQHKASAIMHLTKARNSIQQALLEAKNGLQMDMYKLSDKVINSVATRCVCCRVRGFNDCPASAVQRIHGRRLELLDNEATSPGPNRKRPHNIDDCTSVSKKSSSGASGGLLNFFKTNLMAIAQLYADLPANTPATVFGQCCTNLQKRKYVFQHGFATDPWGKGVVPHPPHGPTTDLLAAHLSKLPEQDLQRIYIIHASPRFIRTSGLAISQQLVGTRGLHHELMSIIMRRYTQSDQEANSECPYMKWRHNMEPDFAKIVLADHEYVTKHIHPEPARWQGYPVRHNFLYVFLTSPAGGWLDSTDVGHDGEEAPCPSPTHQR
ncbi:uncharacterized protein LOC119302632 isoform X2 [Triticum dicoccoides]|uniref:uncharacterized protein LOC119302632 isoform X2 n=1 Tax=Triticum dicoccoides TaxID=85692 RepID=UPI000E79D628|nr:uncharacterized protein LOC119302632 isoform X2 [Triticum dicoccoides]